MKKISPLVILLFILNSHGIFSQQVTEEVLYKTTADKIIRSALEDRWGYEKLRELCKIGPRLSGSENSYKAIEWAVEEMNKMNLDSVWFQPVMVPHWERGDVESAEIIFPDKSIKKLNIAAVGGSIATPESGITAEVIEINSLMNLESLKENIKGKIVFFNKTFDQGLPLTFSGYSDGVRIRSYGAIEAARYGAVAFLMRSLTTKHDHVPHTGMLRYSDSIPRIPAAALGYIDAGILNEALIKNPNLKIKLQLRSQQLPDTLSYNVIAEIKGSEFPDEVIVVSGHIDSWDVGDGAHDDGAGCMHALEVLHLFKKLHIKPKRTIRCIFFINEENGVKGGRKYGEYAASSFEKHLAAIESDRGAFTPEGFSVTGDSIYIKKMKEWLPILENSGISYFKKGGSGVDISFIKNAAALIGYVPDGQRYFDVHHSANDVFEAVHPREMELGSAAIAILAYLLSEEGL